MIMANLNKKLGHIFKVKKYKELAENCKISFNMKFYNEDTKCLFDVLGDRRKAGIINTSKITKISYYKDVPFAMIKIDVKDNMVILPIILLEQKEAEKICKAIIEIYKSRGLFIPRVRKITLAEDEREKINRICEADGMEINNERYQKNKKDEITSFSSDSE